MISQVIQFKNLDQKYKDILNAQLDGDAFVYLIKDKNQNVKSITTSVLNSIKKTQVAI